MLSLNSLLKVEEKSRKLWFLQKNTKYTNNKHKGPKHVQSLHCLHNNYYIHTTSNCYAPWGNNNCLLSKAVAFVSTKRFSKKFHIFPLCSIPPMSWTLRVYCFGPYSIGTHTDLHNDNYGRRTKKDITACVCVGGCTIAPSVCKCMYVSNISFFR